MSVCCECRERYRSLVYVHVHETFYSVIGGTVWALLCDAVTSHVAPLNKIPTHIVHNSIT